MELATFIKELLYEHDCVIVPDFGGFVANYRPAAVDYNRHTFAPPSKDITFNRSLTNNDGLLIGHVSQRTGMSYVDARRWVSGRVKEWKRRLEKGRRLEVAGLGEFRLGKDRNLVFEPRVTENFLADAYGLETFRFLPLEEQGMVKGVAAARPVTGRRVRRILLGVPAAAALAALVYVGWNTRLGRERLDLSSFNIFRKSTVTEAPAPVTKPAPAATKSVRTDAPAPADKEEAASAAAATEEMTTPPAAEESATPVVKPVVTGGYYVVAGSFRQQANAEKLRARLEAAGLPVVIMDGPHGFVRVAIGSYADRDEALQVLREQRQKALNGDGYWLLKK